MTIQKQIPVLRHISRVVAASIAAVSLAGAALADARAEAFVEENAKNVLQTLSSPDLTSAERTSVFSDYMNQFADIPRVARFAVGRYGRQMSAEEFDAYFEAFTEYAMAVYEVQLDQYRGETINVTGSIDLKPGDVVVKSQIPDMDTGDVLNIEWRVRQDKNNPDAYKVLDVAVNLEGSQIWLAQEQRAQFVAILDRANGDVNELINRIHGMTQKLRESEEAGVETRFGDLDADAEGEAG
ncbi:MAG: ABC transporter substrate-binding protein [Pseudomonadota bacterium]